MFFQRKKTLRKFFAQLKKTLRSRSDFDSADKIIAAPVSILPKICIILPEK